MSKRNIASKSLVIPASRPRNPFGTGVNMAKAGKHQPSRSALRQKDSNAIQKILSGSSFEMLA